MFYTKSIHSRTVFLRVIIYVSLIINNCLHLAGHCSPSNINEPSLTDVLTSLPTIKESKLRPIFNFSDVHPQADTTLMSFDWPTITWWTRPACTSELLSYTVKFQYELLLFDSLSRMALDVVEFPEDIAWLDLSFNDITSVSDDILEFPALKMIYLHGNKIRRFADVQKLQQLPNLYSLTLHGNPIENYPNYRSSIICMFPQLKSLDFAKVTEAEKDKAKLHIIVNNSNVKKYSL